MTLHDPFILERLETTKKHMRKVFYIDFLIRSNSMPSICLAVFVSNNVNQASGAKQSRFEMKEEEFCIFMQIFKYGFIAKSCI